MEEQELYDEFVNLRLQDLYDYLESLKLVEPTIKVLREIHGVLNVYRDEAWEIYNAEEEVETQKNSKSSFLPFRDPQIAKLLKAKIKGLSKEERYKVYDKISTALNRIQYANSDLLWLLDYINVYINQTPEQNPLPVSKRPLTLHCNHTGSFTPYHIWVLQHIIQKTPRLTGLVLQTQFGQIQEKTVSVFLDLFPLLKSLSLSAGTSTFETWKCGIQGIINNPSLTNLHLSFGAPIIMDPVGPKLKYLVYDDNYRDQILEVANAFMAYCIAHQHLKILSFRCLTTDDEIDARILTNIMICNTNITSLWVNDEDLCKKMLKNGDLTKILEQCSGLKRLGLFGDFQIPPPFGKDSDRLESFKLRSIGSRSYRNGPIFDYPSKQHPLLRDKTEFFSNLRILDLSSMNLDAKHGLELALIISKNAQLTELNLEDNFLGYGICDLEEPIIKHGSLTRLNLGHNRIGLDNKKPFDSIINIILNNRTLVHLSLTTLQGDRNGWCTNSMNWERIIKLENALDNNFRLLNLKYQSPGDFSEISSTEAYRLSDKYGIVSLKEVWTNVNSYLMRNRLRPFIYAFNQILQDLIPTKEQRTITRVQQVILEYYFDDVFGDKNPWEYEYELSAFSRLEALETPDLTDLHGTGIATIAARGYALNIWTSLDGVLPSDILSLILGYCALSDYRMDLNIKFNALHESEVQYIPLAMQYSFQSFNQQGFEDRRLFKRTEPTHLPKKSTPPCHTSSITQEQADAIIFSEFGVPEIDPKPDFEPRRLNMLMVQKAIEDEENDESSGCTIM